MQPNKSGGLVVSYTPPDPVVSTTPGPSDNTAIISRVSASQHSNNHNEMIEKAVDRVITSTTAISKLKEVVESEPFKMQTIYTKNKSRPKASPTSKVTHITLDYYLEYISNERLRRMPDRGSAWDRVLHAAQFFGLHISDFGDKINVFLNGELPNTLSQEVRADDISGTGSGQEVFLNGQNNHASINGAIDLITAALTTAHSLLEVYLTEPKYWHYHIEQ